MNKSEFLSELRGRLSQLPEEEIKKSVAYYREMIDDRVEDGMEEIDAVESLGNPADAAEKILMETPLKTLVKTKVRTGKKYSPFVITLLILGSPIWITLLLAGIAVAFSVYAMIFTIIIVMVVLVISLIAGALMIPGGIIMMFTKTLASSIFVIGGGLFSCGLGLLCLCPVKYLTVKLIHLTALIGRKIKSLFIRKEQVQ